MKLEWRSEESRGENCEKQEKQAPPLSNVGDEELRVKLTIITIMWLSHGGEREKGRERGGLSGLPRPIMAVASLPTQKSVGINEKKTVILINKKIMRTHMTYLLFFFLYFLIAMIAYLLKKVIEVPIQMEVPTT